MTEYVFPAVFHPNDDGSYTIVFPDLPGCISEGKTLGNAMCMAESGLKQWIEYLADEKTEIPHPSAIQAVEVQDGEFASLIRVGVKDERAVRRTVSIPKWLDDMVADAGLSLSRVLQDALKERLNVN